MDIMVMVFRIFYFTQGMQTSTFLDYLDSQSSQNLPFS